MPYLHWDHEEQKKEVDKVIEDIQDFLRKSSKAAMKSLRMPANTVNEHTNPETAQDTEPKSDFLPDKRLLENYLHPITAASPLHVRRTLDQFQYYMNDDNLSSCS